MTDQRSALLLSQKAPFHQNIKALHDTERSPALVYAQHFLVGALADHDKMNLAAAAYMAYLDVAPGKGFFTKLNSLIIEVRELLDTQAAPTSSTGLQSALLNAYESSAAIPTDLQHLNQVLQVVSVGADKSYNEGSVLSPALQAALLSAYDARFTEPGSVARTHFLQALQSGPLTPWEAALNLDEDVRVSAILTDETAKTVIRRPRAP